MTSIHHVIALTMHGSLFAACNLFLFSADLMPEPAIITTQYASFLVLVLSSMSPATFQSHHLIGNDFRYFN
jgi:hypothetical protein